MQRRTVIFLGTILLGGFSASISRETLSAELPAPVSGTPVSGTPVSGTPVSGTPVSGTPVSGTPVSGASAAADPFKPVPPADTVIVVEETDFQAEVELTDVSLAPAFEVADATAAEKAEEAEEEEAPVSDESEQQKDEAQPAAEEKPAGKMKTPEASPETTAEDSSEDGKPETEPETTAETKPEPQPETQPKSDNKTESSSEAEPQGEVEPQAEAAPAPKRELPPAVRALQPRIRRVLDFHFQQPADAGKHDVWETMHSFLPYGVDAQIRAPQYRQPVNAIGWVCWNGSCRGNRLFELDKQGRLKPKQGPRVQGHHGQFLAMLAQSYVTPEFEIRVEDKVFTVADLIEFEKETCVPKSELTFKLIALSYYLPADATWQSRDGQQWSLERLLQEEITQQVIGAACGGTHRLGGISFAVKSRKKAGLPMEGVWAKADEYLDAYLKYTFQIQNPDGSFSTNWFDGRGMENDLDRRLQTSGHILEFTLFALPKEKLTSPEVVRAVNYLTTILERNPRRDWSIGPKGHALHALAMYDRLVFGTKPGSRSPAIVQTSLE